MWTSYLSNEDLLDVLKEYLGKNKYTKDIEDEIIFRLDKRYTTHREESYNMGYEHGYEDGQAN